VFGRGAVPAESTSRGMRPAGLSLPTMVRVAWQSCANLEARAGRPQPGDEQILVVGAPYDRCAAAMAATLNASGVLLPPESRLFAGRGAPRRVALFVDWSNGEAPSSERAEGR